MIVSQNTYRAVASGEAHTVRWQSRKVRLRDIDLYAPIHVTNTTTGELQEWTSLERYNERARDEHGNVRLVGCPAPVGTVKQLRFRADDGKARGSLPIVVTSATPFTSDDGRPMWAITWMRCGTRHRPVPYDERGVYLAREHGYTTSPSRSLDADAPVMVDEHVERVIRDDQIHNAEQRKRQLAETKARAERILASVQQELDDLSAA